MRAVKFFCVLLIAIFSVLSSNPSYAGLGDFDLSNSQINTQDLLSGGPQKDGIPALTDPKFIPVNQAQYLRDNDLVVGLARGSESKAYPIRILNWHEVVNDKVADQSVAVTWCPLTHSAVVFDRQVGSETLEFGVSGLLYQSNVAMYDRNYSGLWSQLKGGGLTGKLAKQVLDEVPSILTTWGEWKAKHPNTKVLSKKTGHWRNYKRDPYKDYHESSRVMFPTASNNRLQAKELVVGVKVNNVKKAYPLGILVKLQKPLQDRVGGVNIHINPMNNGLPLITDEQGDLVSAIIVYWFAWSTFHQDTLIYEN